MDGPVRGVGRFLAANVERIPALPQLPLLRRRAQDLRGGRPPGALCRFLGVAEAPLTSTRRSSTSGINEVTEYRDDDGSSIAV